MRVRGLVAVLGFLFLCLKGQSPYKLVLLSLDNYKKCLDLELFELQLRRKINEQ